jgi:inner membrane protein YidH
MTEGRSEQETSAGSESTRAREHLANERTLLAWIRTAIALMGLGFVVARFGLFLREISAIGGQSVQAESVYSGPIGIVLVAAGLLAVVMSTVRFFQARYQIEKGRFEPAAYPEVAVVAFTLIAGAALIVYLALSGR